MPQAFCHDTPTKIERILEHISFNAAVEYQEHLLQPVTTLQRKTGS